MVTIFDTRYTFYEIDGLKSDFLIGYNLLVVLSGLMRKIITVRIMVGPLNHGVVFGFQLTVPP